MVWSEDFVDIYHRYEFWKFFVCVLMRDPCQAELLVSLMQGPFMQEAAFFASHDCNIPGTPVDSTQEIIMKVAIAFP